ncbi:bark storage protein A-like [Cryptomeria japonica]|uniref:bark storage protein A-like n=1 Tax=Cryptomeria japonica TaxID=3369 RepID=UPI0025ABECC3|nr:bark storage protein A-like [Cryptomeria japonica]
MGLVVPNTFEMEPLLQHPNFIVNENVSYVDLSGRRFHVGAIADQKVIVVMTGMGMMNAAITTQLLFSFFNINGVVHYGIAGNGNSDHHIGDVTIPLQWAHTGLWNWQRYGQGEDDELPLESNGDYTRDIGYIHFANYSTEEGIDNLLNNVWYNPDEIFPESGTPEVREHAFWVNVSETYYNLADQLENITLESCINSTTCLSTTPKIVKVERGCSASIFVDNAAYRNFLHEKFDCTPIDMESAAVALVSLSMGKPFIIIRSLSDLAGGSSTENEATIFLNLASKNAVIVVTEFFNLLLSLADKPTNGLGVYNM